MVGTALVVVVVVAVLAAVRRTLHLDVMHGLVVVVVALVVAS